MYSSSIECKDDEYTYCKINFDKGNGSPVTVMNSSNYEVLEITENDVLLREPKTINGKRLVTEDEIDARNIIKIYLTDTDLDILNKFITAFEQGNTDVYFEHGEYEFSNAYTYMKETLGWSWTLEYPIGHNNRYFFNGSKIIANPTVSNDSCNIFGSHAGKSYGGNYELYDGHLVMNNHIYCVHDEMAYNSNFYKHSYKNMIMEAYNSTREIGGGCGINGVV